MVTLDDCCWPGAELHPARAGGRYRCEAVTPPQQRERLLRVETAISDFSRAAAQIGNADYLLIRPPAAGLADYAKSLIMESEVAASGKRLSASGLAEVDAVVRLT